MKLIHTLDLNVRYGETGYNGVATLSSLANWLQEAAGQSASSLGFGEEVMTPYGLTWILTRLVLRIHRLPQAEEAVQVTSWPSHRDRLAHRGYKVYDGEGKLLVSGGSAWSLMEMASRKLATIPEELLQVYPENAPACDGFLGRALPRAKKEAEVGTSYSTPIRVRKDDLDINGHVNNAHYLSWLLEPLPYNTADVLSPALVDLTFRAECFPQEELTSMCHEGDMAIPDEPALLGSQPVGLVHAIRRTSPTGESEDVCRAITLWRTSPLHG